MESLAIHGCKPDAMPIEITDDLVPLKKPHYTRREGELHFLISPGAQGELDDEDATLWDRIDGRATVGDLRRDCPDVEARLRRFWIMGVCELAPAAFPGNRRRVLVVEPHMDDAVFSVGALMWSLRAECEFTVATIVGRTNFTLYWLRDTPFFDVARVSELRRAESALAARMLGGRHLTLDEPDAPQRYEPGDWTLDWFRRHRQPVEAFREHAAPDGDIEVWAIAIGDLLATTEAEEVWLPLGVGNHADHERARNACLRALARLPGMERRKSLYFYQDVPYANRFPAHTDRILAALAEAGGVLERRAEEIGAAMDGKLRLASIYASQFPLSYLAPRIEEAARRASGTDTGRCELRFAVTIPPGPVDPFAVYSGRADVERAVPKLRAWYPRHREAPRIRILSPEAVGRWADDLSFLLEAFPRAILEVHVSEACAGETERLVSPRIEVRIVPAGAWRRRFLQIAIARPRALIVLAGERRRFAARLARVAFAPSRPFVATRMDHLILALRLARET